MLFTSNSLKKLRQLGLILASFVFILGCGKSKSQKPLSNERLNPLSEQGNGQDGSSKSENVPSSSEVTGKKTSGSLENGNDGGEDSGSVPEGNLKDRIETKDETDKEKLANGGEGEVVSGEGVVTSPEEISETFGGGNTKFTFKDQNDSLKNALAHFPKSTKKIKRTHDDIKSFKVWNSGDYDIWVKFLYHNQAKNNQLSVVYFWCHFHGTTIACHPRGLATVPLDKFNEPGCEKSPYQCEDYQKLNSKSES